MNRQNDTHNQPPFAFIWWPITVMTAAVDGYFEAFFACFCHEDPWGDA